MISSMDKVAIVIPAYNEGPKVGAVVREILDEIGRLEYELTVLVRRLAIEHADQYIKDTIRRKE